jgi:molybdate transport system substrate-binding protein
MGPRRPPVGVFLFLLLLCWTFHACKGEKQEVLIRIAAAANVREALEEIAEDFRKQTGYACEIVSGSSGKLTAQIREGAPFDLLVSADQEYPAALHREGFTAEPPKIYALGQLVLWSASAAEAPTLEDLKAPETRSIAMAQPDIAPYGRAAREALKSHGLYKSLRPKLIYGESIAQVNQFISSGAADYGFTSLSTVRSRQFGGQGHWSEVDRAAYQPISQAACLLKSGGDQRAGAIEFYTYLFSGAARHVFEAYGYQTP